MNGSSFMPSREADIILINMKVSSKYYAINYTYSVKNSHILSFLSQINAGLNSEF